MKTIFLDYETYWSQHYTLSGVNGLTPVEYILDPRFKMHIVSVAEDDGPVWVMEEPEWRSYLSKQNPNKVCMVSHNQLFDGCITAWRYDFVPALYVDTVGLSRALLSHELKSVSLFSVSAHLGLGTKDVGALASTKGMTLENIKENGLYPRFSDYAKKDTEQCRGIYRALMPRIDAREIVFADSIMRCCIQPQFRYDLGVLHAHLQDNENDKALLLAQAGMLGAADVNTLRSDTKFAELLASHGVVLSKKISPTTGKANFAFSLTDKEFMDLAEHEDPAIQVLHAARVGWKSTIEQSRTERFISIANLDWGGRVEKNGTFDRNVTQARWAPVPLKYSGAHTHRLSGDWKLNKQNMTRGGKLRKSMVVDPDKVCVTVDSSQIEARIVAFLCGQEDLLEQFERNEDVYSNFASDVFGYPVHKATHKLERFCGKTAILGLGYNLGPDKFHLSLHQQAKAQLGVDLQFSKDKTAGIVYAYRRKYDTIPATWKRLGANMHAWVNGVSIFKIGPCEFKKIDGLCVITLPSGLHLKYKDLFYDENDKFGPTWKYQYAGEWRRCYGGSLLENITQALARVVISDAAVDLRRVLKVYDTRLAMQVHDELVYVAPKIFLDPVKELLEKYMNRRQGWYTGVPLACEVGSGPSYGDAK